ncbi:MAG: hypothetical protein IPN76_05925 [Saprospiraceae bacterium]|nr:hypothetical protein [Saprospiraceae bacterium]
MNKSVLIIDDEYRAKFLVKYLEEFSDSRIMVDFAQTIKEAIELIESKIYKVILCDLMMPPENFYISDKEFVFNEEDNFNGKKIIEYCVNKGIEKETKIIITSGSVTLSKQLVENYNHAIEMLVKPFSCDELLEKIENTH